MKVRELNEGNHKFNNWLQEQYKKDKDNQEKQVNKDSDKELLDDLINDVNLNITGLTKFKATNYYIIGNIFKDLGMTGDIALGYNYGTHKPVYYPKSVIEARTYYRNQYNKIIKKHHIAKPLFRGVNKLPASLILAMLKHVKYVLRTGSKEHVKFAR